MPLLAVSQISFHHTSLSIETHEKANERWDGHGFLQSARWWSLENKKKNLSLIQVSLCKNVSSTPKPGGNVHLNGRENLFETLKLQIDIWESIW